MWVKCPTTLNSWRLAGKNAMTRTSPVMWMRLPRLRFTTTNVTSPTGNKITQLVENSKKRWLKRWIKQWAAQTRLTGLTTSTHRNCGSRRLTVGVTPQSTKMVNQNQLRLRCASVSLAKLVVTGVSAPWSGWEQALVSVEFSGGTWLESLMASPLSIRSPDKWQ